MFSEHILVHLQHVQYMSEYTLYVISLITVCIYEYLQKHRYISG
jgi:hypothetical protein